MAQTSTGRIIKLLGAGSSLKRMQQTVIKNEMQLIVINSEMSDFDGSAAELSAEQWRPNPTELLHW